jgi:hypothetical protein
MVVSDVRMLLIVLSGNLSGFWRVRVFYKWRESERRKGKQDEDKKNGEKKWYMTVSFINRDSISRYRKSRTCRANLKRR